MGISKNKRDFQIRAPESYVNHVSFCFLDFAALSLQLNRSRECMAPTRAVQGPNDPLGRPANTFWRTILKAQVFAVDVGYGNTKSAFRIGSDLATFMFPSLAPVVVSDAVSSFGHGVLSDRKVHAIEIDGTLYEVGPGIDRSSAYGGIPDAHFPRISAPRQTMSPCYSVHCASRASAKSNAWFSVFRCIASTSIPPACVTHSPAPIISRTAR